MQFHRLDFDALEAELLSDPDRLVELLAFYKVEGWGEDRADLRAGHQTMILLRTKGVDVTAAQAGHYLGSPEGEFEAIRQRDNALLGGASHGQ